MTRRTLEIAGFFTIAAALHVSAAAIMLPDQLERGEPADAPPAALSAGGPEVQVMVEAWEAPPEVAAPAEMPEAPPQPEPEPAPPAADAVPEVALALAPPMAPPMSPPEAAPLRPNLPDPPPPPRIDPAQLDLPELQNLTPPQIAPPLALAASARPERRPERRAARQEPEPQRQRQQQAERQPALASAPAPQQAGQGRQSQAASAGGGGGGVSAQQRASLMGQWSAQISSCINRRLRAPRGVRGDGLVLLALTIGRDGAIRGIGLAASSGEPAIDQAASDAARRAGRCPAAPAGLNDASYGFELPIRVNLR